MTSDKKNASLLTSYPPFIQEKNSQAWDKIDEFYRANDSGWVKEGCSWSEPFVKSLFQIWARSDFVRDQSVRNPLWLSGYAAKDSSLLQVRDAASYENLLLESVSGVSDESQFMHLIRKFRQFEMMRIIWRDLCDMSTFQQTASDVSSLADVCVLVAQRFAYENLASRYGFPRSGDARAEKQNMLVIAMGKHGGRELNVSSDIDLILVYPESGMTDHDRKSIDNHLFFTKLGQKMIQYLDQVTVDGFVFRVDLRLRPYGESGAIALNISAFEEYYHHQGREWERYAMIKARILYPHTNTVESDRLMAIISPFVYRKYADFSSVQALRDMKRLITSEVHRKGGDQNIKLGRGGIREVEFISQACQLIHGGRDESIQNTSLLASLGSLKANQYLPEDWVDELMTAYIFLRDLEHAIQGLADKQTQLIPESEEEKLRVAWSMGFDDWSQLDSVLSKHRNSVEKRFELFLVDPENDDAKISSGGWLDLWQLDASEKQWCDALGKANFESPEDSYLQLVSIRENRQFISMSPDASQRFEKFLPLLLETVSHTVDPSKTLARVLALVNVILGRSVYFVLLYENIDALKQLCHLCSESPWIAAHLVKTPVILDELIDVRNLYRPPSKEGLKDELRQQLLRIPEDDLESQMNCLRTFRQSHMLKVAAAEIGSHLPLMKVSDYLTFLAETILEQAVHIAWRNLTDKYGEPSGLGLSGLPGSGFAVIGYGKLGGIELGYSSDLDMVFLYDCDDLGQTTGQKSIDNQVFYIRLGQRIIHILSAQTTQGILYESDMRLRPSGNSGLLVSSLKAFEKYQREGAWIWEHQALVRARGITGDPDLIERFNMVRQSVLSQDRDRDALKQEVVSMREKMKVQSDVDDLKQGSGGLVDIEFIVQFGVLNYCQNQRQLIEWTDNIRIIETLVRSRSFDEVDIAPLVSIYRKLRSALHRKSLSSEEYLPSLKDYPEMKSQVVDIWKQIFENSSSK